MSEKIKLLMVDDEPRNVKYPAMLLKDDFEVFTAGSGDEALELIDSEQIELIITDNIMPGMNGIQLAKAIKTRNSNASIYLTSGFIDSDVQELINDGILTGSFSKPVSIEMIQKTLKEHCK